MAIKKLLTIELSNGTTEDFNFSNDVTEWSDLDDAGHETEDYCCLLSSKENKDILHENFAAILTKAQVRGRADLKDAIDDEIKKF